jgi:hypothetical protein
MLLTAVDSPAQTAPAPADYSYADLVDRALAAPIVVVATISDTIRLKPERAPGVAPGHARLYVEASADTLIRGAGGLPPSLTYLVDVPLNAKGRVPDLDDTQVLLLARPVAGKPGELQLIAPDAQLPQTPELEQRIRAILTEVLRPDAPPPITGITSAFHVDGTIPGEGETQIFLSTREQRPISLSVLSRPGQQKQWSVALGEIVDQAAKAPPKDSLLWYRLACGLPRELPAEAVADLGGGAAQDARSDYDFVLQQLGPCTRTHPLTRS